MISVRKQKRADRMRRGKALIESMEKKPNFPLLPEEPPYTGAGSLLWRKWAPWEAAFVKRGRGRPRKQLWRNEGSLLGEWHSIEVRAPAPRGRPKKLTSQQRLDIGSYIANRQWEAAVASAQARYDASPDAKFYRNYRAKKHSAPPKLPRTLSREGVSNRGRGGTIKETREDGRSVVRPRLPKKRPLVDLSIPARVAYEVARAADWYLLQGGYDAFGQPLRGLELRVFSEPIKRPRGVGMGQHRKARAYCADKFKVTISADTAQECYREFLALEERLTGKKREFSKAPVRPQRSRKRISPYRNRRSRATKPKAADWIHNAYGRDKID